MARTSTKADAKPSYQFYPDAWLADAALRLCSLAARGLWQDMLCIMWRSPRRGYLLKPNGTKIEPGELARLVCGDEQDVVRSLAQLGENEVYSIDEDGSIYSRRMVREEGELESLSSARAAAGRIGGQRSGEARRAKQTAKQTPSKTQQSQAGDSGLLRSQEVCRKRLTESNTEANEANEAASSPTPTPTPDSESRKGNTELNREGREDSPLKSSEIQTRTETQSAAGFVPPELDPSPTRQHPEAMIRDMALTRDVTWDLVLEHAGGPPPWAAHTVTELRAWLQPQPRFTEAQLDQRSASRRQRDGPRRQPVHVGEVAERIKAEAGETRS